MYKLVILISELAQDSGFDERWPDFLAQAERMPGLLRESTSHIAKQLHGDNPLHMIHEMYFDSLNAAAEALGSPAGQHAGNILHEITQGRVELFLADHNEDLLSNIQDHQNASDSAASPGDE
jgi:uncharacterized protein (TIGR02118 family)